MSIELLYVDFFRFLDHFKEGDPWLLYQRLYLQPHRNFLEAYWETFKHFDEAQIASRVRQIKKEDYGHLRSLINVEDPAGKVEETLEQCRSMLQLPVQPPVYLFVGFFSADGATVEVDGRPSIALGLERFKDFKDLSLLVAHEYCHCAQRLLKRGLFAGAERTLLLSVIAEGLAVLFTESLYPLTPLHRHLFLSPERLQWCKENREALLDLAGADLASAKLVPILFGEGDPNAGIPPKVGYFVAREMLGHCLSHHGVEEFRRLFPGFEQLLQKIIKKDGGHAQAED